MGRPAIPLGTHGAITCKQASGSWQAQTTVRAADGTYKRVTRTGPTKGLAQRRLKDQLALLETSGLSATTSVTVGTMLDRWIAHLTMEGRLRPQSIRDYARTVRQVKATSIARLTLGEATPGVVAAYLRALKADGHVTRAVNASRALTGAFRLAVEQDLLRRSPMTEITKPAGATPIPVALTPEQVEVLRSTTREWRRGSGHGGPPASGLLPDVVELLLGTGVRIGEALGLRWEDVRLTPTAGHVTICGTVVQAPGGLVRQPMPKTSAGHRTLAVPGRTHVVLARRHEANAASASPSPYVFPSQTGDLMSPANLRRQWRAAVAGTIAESATPVVVRHTVATHLARTVSLEAASHQLGHSSVAVTRKHYVERAVPTVSHADALEGL